jgi:hypothetical protein
MQLKEESVENSSRDGYDINIGATVQVSQSTSITSQNTIREEDERTS